MIARIIAFIKRLFGKKDPVLRTSSPTPDPGTFDPRERVMIRRHVPVREFVGPFYVPSGVYRAKKESAFIEERTPKGAHVVTASGARMHRKNRDIALA